MEEVRPKSRKPYKPHPYSERLEAVTMYRNGMGSKRIASTLGIDDSMVRAWLRKYRKYGLDSLQPYRRAGKENSPLARVQRAENEHQFEQACIAFVSTLEPVASITRRYRLDYHSFQYHVQRYHPELVEKRNRLKEIII
jgi:transposase